MRGNNGRATKDRTREINKKIGSRVYVRRNLLGLTQRQLGEAIGVLTNQVHKYERGINGIPSNRLPELANALAVPVGYFFEGWGEGEAIHGAKRISEFVANFSAIEDSFVQEDLLHLVQDVNARHRRRLAARILAAAQ